MELQAGRPVPAEQRDEVYRGMLDQMIGLRLLKQETQRRQVTATDAELDEAMKQVRAQFPNDAAFQDALKSQKMTIDELRKETRSNLLISKMLDQEITPQLTVKPSDDQRVLREESRQVPAARIHPRQPRPDRRAAECRRGATRQKARAKAEDVLKQAKAGADFAKLAADSTRTTPARATAAISATSRRARWCRRSRQAAFALKPGEISGVVESPFGYHIIKLTDRKPAHTVPFGEVSSRRSSSSCSRRCSPTKTREFVEGLKAKGKVEVLISTSATGPVTEQAAVRVDVWLDVSCLFKTRSEAQARVRGRQGGREWPGLEATSHAARRR